MPLQNRCTPFGELIATPARGTLMGNRGRLHDAFRRVVRRVDGGYRAWVTCQLTFKGRRRRVMTPDRYTELFFLDEATALAAGHRPCGECRRADHRRFKAAWLAGNPDRVLADDAPVRAIDCELERDRLGPGRAQRTFPADIAALPDGVFITAGAPNQCVLLWRGALWPWSPFGYGPPAARPAGIRVTVLTPRSSVGAIAAGYEPGVHRSIPQPSPH